MRQRGGKQRNAVESEQLGLLVCHSSKHLVFCQPCSKRDGQKLPVLELWRVEQLLCNVRRRSADTVRNNHERNAGARLPTSENRDTSLQRGIVPGRVHGYRVGLLRGLQPDLRDILSGGAPNAHA